ncbi:hypothetical protein [Bacillus sp. Hm123]|uniref:hypothetical protein n=1 Tax=Bacillus sp. Hm123 TaxID=3450745 RepID=UPI003F4276A0
MNKNKKTNLSNSNESLQEKVLLQSFNNPLGQLLYLDYEIKDLNNRNSPSSLEKAINKKTDLIKIIEEIDDPSLKYHLTTYYIDKKENSFIKHDLRKLKSRKFPKLYLSEQAIQQAAIAKRQISKVLNNDLILTIEELEMVISDLEDSLDRIILRKVLFDKKNQTQIAKEININTFRRASSEQPGKSTFNKSTVSRRLKKLKCTTISCDDF